MRNKELERLNSAENILYGIWNDAAEIEVTHQGIVLQMRCRHCGRKGRNSFMIVHRSDCLVTTIRQHAEEYSDGLRGDEGNGDEK